MTRIYVNAHTLMCPNATAISKLYFVFLSLNSSILFNKTTSLLLFPCQFQPSRSPSFTVHIKISSQHRLTNKIFVNTLTISQNARRIPGDNSHWRNIPDNNRTCTNNCAPSNMTTAWQDNGIGRNPNIVFYLDTVSLACPFWIIHVVRTSNDTRPIADNDMIPNFYGSTTVEFYILKRATVTDHKITPPPIYNSASKQHFRQLLLHSCAMCELSNPCGNAPASAQTNPRNNEPFLGSTHLLHIVSFALPSPLKSFCLYKRYDFFADFVHQPPYACADEHLLVRRQHPTP